MNAQHQDAAGLPVLVVDGAKFDDFDGFQSEFSSLLSDWQWTGNLDAFNDILRGGFGTPEDGWVFRWANSGRSREVLGHEATWRYLESLLPRAHPSNHDRLRDEIRAARRGEGQTLFDVLIEIIETHGPGGDEGEDNVILDLA